MGGRGAPWSMCSLCFASPLLLPLRPGLLYFSGCQEMTYRHEGRAGGGSVPRPEAPSWAGGQGPQRGGWGSGGLATLGLPLPPSGRVTGSGQALLDIRAKLGSFTSSRRIPPMLGSLVKGASGPACSWRPSSMWAGRSCAGGADRTRCPCSLSRGPRVGGEEDGDWLCSRLTPQWQEQWLPARSWEAARGLPWTAKGPGKPGAAVLTDRTRPPSRRQTAFSGSSCE